MSSSASTSTCTTVKPVTSKKHHQPLQNEGHRVRFAPQLETVLSHVLHRQDMSDQDIQDRFLVQDDVMAIRAHAKLTTKYYRLKDPHMMNAIDGCFDETSQLVGQAIADNPKSTDNDTSFQRLVDLVDATALNEWCGRIKFHGRGLERYCSEHQRKVRAKAILLARSRTVQSQYACTPDELATVYRKCTRVPMLFALVMAQADHQTAIEPDEDDLMNERLAEVSRLTEINPNACAPRPFAHSQPRPTITSSKRSKPSIFRRFKSAPSNV